MVTSFENRQNSGFREGAGLGWDAKRGWVSEKLGVFGSVLSTTRYGKHF